MRQRETLGLSVLAVALVGLTSLRAQDPMAKKPIPDAGSLRRALTLVEEVYGREFRSAGELAQKISLVDRLLQKADESAADPTAQYALLKVAKDIAVLAGEGELAVRTVDKMAATFAIEVFPAKIETLLKAAEAAQQAKQRATIVAQAAILIKEAVQQDAFADARALSQMAIDAARRSGDLEILKNMVAQDKDLEQTASAYEDAKDSFARLKVDVVDPDANLVVGRYYSLVKGDWEKGRSYLALGSDETLKALAIKELKGVFRADEQVAMGDGWWEFAATNEEDVARQCQARAGYWYRLALPSLTGLSRDKVESRLSLLRADKTPRPTLHPKIAAQMKKVAIWVLQQNGQLQVQLQDDDASVSVNQLSMLPQEPFVVTSINLNGRKHINDRDVQNLAGIRSLETLSLGDTAITDAGLGFLRTLPNLRELNLAGTKVRDAGMVTVGMISGLEVLLLGGTRIGDKGIVYLSRLTNLRRLGLAFTQVTDQGIAALSGLKRLEWINPYDTKITDNAIRQFWPQCQIEGR